MNTRDYQDQDHDCKSICIAECLSPGIVPPNDFSTLFVPNSGVEAFCMEKMRKAGVNVRLTVNPGMFL